MLGKLATMTKITYLLIIGIPLFLFIGVVPIVELSAAGTDADKSAENLAIVHRLYEEVLNTGKLDRVDALIPTTYVDHNPLNPGLDPGREGFKQALTIFRSAFPDLHFTIEETLSQADKVFVRAIMHGTHKGEFMGIVPTGKQVTVTEMAIYRVADGMVTESWGALDGISLMQQLGLIHPTVWQHTMHTSEESEATDDPNGETDDWPWFEREAIQVNLDGIQLSKLVHLDQLKKQFQSENSQIRVVALLSPN